MGTEHLAPHQIRPGDNVPPAQGGGVKTRGPDRRPRRLLRRMLLAALVAEGPITIEIQKPGGGPVRRKTIRGQQAAAHQLLIAIQQVARQAQKNPMAVLRLLELIGQEVDGRPMAAGTDTTQRSTTFVYETSEPGASGPSSVADVVVGDEPPEDEGFERVEG